MNHAALCTLIKEQRETTVSRVPIPLCTLWNMKSGFSLFEKASDGATWNIWHRLGFWGSQQDMGALPLILQLLCFTIWIKRKSETILPA